MIAWSTLGKLAWDVFVEEPDPTSPLERAKRAYETVEDVSDACGLFNDACKLSEGEELDDVP